MGLRVVDGAVSCCWYEILYTSTFTHNVGSRMCVPTIVAATTRPKARARGSYFALPVECLTLEGVWA